MTRTLTLILLVCAALRIHGLAWGLPYLLDGDEFRVLNNGLSVYYTSAQFDTLDTEMQNYPPWRSWEVALTRALLAFFFGEPVSTGTQVIFSRFLTVAYSLLTTALLYKIGRYLTGQAVPGLVTAGFFATWPEGIDRLGRLVLADSAALFFFTFCIYVSLRAHRTRQSDWLLGAGMLGILAGLAKYNMGIIALLPGLLFLRELRLRPVSVIQEVALPGLFLLLPFVALMSSTWSNQGMMYRYLNPGEQQRHLETRLAVGEELSAPEQANYADLSASFAGRIWRKLELLEDFLPLPFLLLALLGWLLNIQRVEFLGLMLVALLTLGLLSLFPANGGRQLLGGMVILLLFMGAAVSGQRLLVAGMLIVLIGQGVMVWRAVPTAPDSRAATVDWLIQNAPDGSLIAADSYIFELDPLNGFNSSKQFSQAIGPEWRSIGADFVVWSDELQESGLQLAADFEDSDYSGPSRFIYRVHESP